jgi:hypothetical protein
VKVCRSLRLADGARREADSATSSRPVFTASKRTGLLSATRSSSASWLAVPSNPITFCRNRLSFAHATISSIRRVSQRARAISAFVDYLGKLAGAQHWHRVDYDCARFGRGKPTRHHGRVVGRANQHATSGLMA